MKKLLSEFVTLLMLLEAGLVRNTMAQQNIAQPPLLTAQDKISTVPGPGIPPPPSVTPVSPPGHPSLPSGMAGTPIVQTMPTEMLLSNLQQAVATAEKLNQLLRQGKVWTRRAPAGEMEIKAGILYHGAVVAVLHFNPLNGNVLPLGISPNTYQSSTQLQVIKSRLSSLIAKLKIQPLAEFIAPEACWSFPVATGNIIVAHIKVYYDGIHVVQDYAANQEMTFYGQ